MSDEMEQFEKHLRRQTPRQLPSDWRKEILAAAQAQPARRPQSATNVLVWLLRQRLTSIFWPHPVAWGGLAAVWVFIGALHYSMGDATPALAVKTAPPSPQAVAELQQQRQLFAELMGWNDMPTADRPKNFVPKPRSENVGILTA